MTADRQPERLGTSADGLLSLTPYEARTLAVIWDRMFPADQHSAAASELGAITYLDRALVGPYAGLREHYRMGLQGLESGARARFGQPVFACTAEQVDELITSLQGAELPDFGFPRQFEFFVMLLGHLQEGVFSDPAHGGNRDLGGWRFLAHPGVHTANDASDHLSAEPLDKPTRSLADAGWRLSTGTAATRGAPVTVPGWDPQDCVGQPSGDRDAIIVGLGAVGSLAAQVLTARGMRVLALEAGPWRFGGDFIPDELGSTYYTRGAMGPKFLSEAPTWRPDVDTPATPAPFSLGRMMNSVGGSVIQWGGAVRRQHPHHFAYRSHVADRWGAGVLPAGNTLVDWPVGYDDLADYYTALEYSIGVASDRAANPFIPETRPYPLPPVRPFTMGEQFTAATRRLGLHPYPTPTALNSRPYNDNRESSYAPFSGGGFGPFDDGRWVPGHNWVPAALATGNLELKTGCRVLRVLTDASGRACGVEYADPLGVTHDVRADKVILASYTFENLRLMWLSADDAHPAGLGNNAGVLGQHYMTKHWNDVYGYFPDRVFNAASGPSAQMVTLDDYASAGFDPLHHGFVGGASFNVENQRLPIQISREPLPPGVPAWGLGYKNQLRRWQHLAAVRFQPDALPYVEHRLDLDPRVCDRSGLGRPVVRITYRIQENEARLSAFMRKQAQRMLREMGAAQVWNGLDFTGIVSSHDLGGARMGTNPGRSVVSPDLAVHDTPGLYVFSGAVFPSMSSVNPTLTLWALCYRAAERMLAELGAS